jgi:hypothetical protein
MTKLVEMLSLFYALLAAITGVGGAEAVAVASPVSVEAAAAQHDAGVAERTMVAASVLFNRAQPMRGVWAPVRTTRNRWAVAPAIDATLFATATFANRRE